MGKRGLGWKQWCRKMKEEEAGTGDEDRNNGGHGRTSQRGSEKCLLDRMERIEREKKK